MPLRQDEVHDVWRFHRGERPAVDLLNKIRHESHGPIQALAIPERQEALP